MRTSRIIAFVGSCGVATLTASEEIEEYGSFAEDECVAFYGVAADLCEWTATEGGLDGCREACEEDPSCWAIQWAGEKAGAIDVVWCDKCIGDREADLLESSWGQSEGSIQVRTRACLADDQYFVWPYYDGPEICSQSYDPDIDACGPWVDYAGCDAVWGEHCPGLDHPGGAEYNEFMVRDACPEYCDPDHDPSKCREYDPDSYDDDCCGYEYETWCADGYVKVHGPEDGELCWPGFKGYRCYPPEEVPDCRDCTVEGRRSLLFARLPCC